MTAIGAVGDSVGSEVGLLDRRRIIAGPGFNRWLVPPAALAIHLCIGMAYGFSVFWLPLSKALGHDKSVECPGMSLFQALVTTSCDWRISDLVWIYTLFFVALGLSAATWGGWLERAGPRKAGIVSAFCWCGGMALAAFGVIQHQLWIMWLGLGVIGGIGLGIGYISPVSTLIKWFPDRRGMATGMAIMGFGGGAMIGAPLANLLMNNFKTADSVGVWQTFLALAAIYFVFMVGGAFGYRLPPPGWAPSGWTPQAAKTMIVAKQVHLKDAHKTKQFWLIWAVLCLNVSAGIGVIGIASPMLQEIFGGSLIGRPDVPFTALDPAQGQAVATIAAGFAGLLSLFNIGGRFFWASLSDVIGRKATYFTFFALGILLYASAPWAAHAGSKAMFVLFLCIILSMYGGGFATIPAYLADIFGTQFVGAIHGRLLTAWSTAGIIGPVVVSYIREFEIAAGVPRQSVYDVTLYILAGFLVVGFLCNWAVKPLKESQRITWLVQRMNRRQYILFWLPTWTVLLLLYLTNSIPSTSALGALLFIVISVVQTITAMKRLHDMNLAGWFALLIYVPIVNIVFLLALFLIPGAAGPNRFDHARWFMSEEEVAALQTAPAHAHAQIPKSELQKAEASASVPLAWLAVGIPIAWGVWVTLKSAFVLFG